MEGSLQSVVGALLLLVGDTLKSVKGVLLLLVSGLTVRRLRIITLGTRPLVIREGIITLEGGPSNCWKEVPTISRRVSTVRRRPPKTVVIALF